MDTLKSVKGRSKESWQRSLQQVIRQTLSLMAAGINGKRLEGNTCISRATSLAPRACGDNADKSFRVAALMSLKLAVLSVRRPTSTGSDRLTVILAFPQGDERKGKEKTGKKVPYNEKRLLAETKRATSMPKRSAQYRKKKCRSSRS